MDAGQPLLTQSATVGSVVDYNGRPASRSGTGGRRSAAFLIVVLVLERIAVIGLATNLIMYLTEVLCESNVTAAANLNAWKGVAYILPLLGAFLADSWLGYFLTIIWSTLLCILGMGYLTISSFFPTLRPTCDMDGSCSSTQMKIALCYCSIYLVAISQGGNRPCLQAFGASQFDEDDPVEYEWKSSFFNWSSFGMCFGNVTTTVISSYIQENIGWGPGFGVPCIAMLLSLLVLLAGRGTYRYGIQQKMDSKFGAFRGIDGIASGLFKVLPIWATCLVYAVVLAQPTTFFIKQGAVMDRRIGPTFQVPSASLRSVVGLTTVALIPIYDRFLVPIARKVTGIRSGITTLQRIGTGLVLSMLSMVAAAMVEMKRLGMASELGLVDIPDAVVPMSIWWLVPQYVLIGTADVFAMVGLQEFFYDQAPGRQKSLGVALYLSMYGVGSFISGSLVALLDMVTGGDGGQGSWFSDNLNRGHLDYFYLVLAGLNAVHLIVYLYFSRAYVYPQKAVIY